MNNPTKQRSKNMSKPPIFNQADVTDQVLEDIEADVSMGANAWDCVPPKEIIAAAWNRIATAKPDADLEARAKAAAEAIQFQFFNEEPAWGEICADLILRHFQGVASGDKNVCPCLIAETPCHPHCTCRQPTSSIGCACCSSYGSKDQQKAKAQWLVNVITSWESEKRELVEALKPFAGLDIAHADRKPDGHPVFGLNRTQFTLGDVRKAKAALKKAGVE